MEATKYAVFTIYRMLGNSHFFSDNYPL